MKPKSIKGKRKKLVVKINIMASFIQELIKQDFSEEYIGICSATMMSLLDSIIEEEL